MSFFNTYLNDLDTLVFDSPNTVVQTEKEIADELDLWSNAQFTFDVTPGVGIRDEEKKSTVQGLDSATYESLVNYLDYDLPSRPEVKSVPTKGARILPRPPTMPAAPVVIPKTAPVINPLPTIVPTKRPIEEESEKTISPEEDKRRRNTAASARFRIKKKLREQAMEQSVQEMTLKSEKLQERVNQLEAEIQFLRNLLLDKASN